MRWNRLGSRSYTRKSMHTEAYVFGDPRPTQLWAWAVYWMGGSASGVETGMLNARKKAEDWTQKVDKQNAIGAAS